MPNMPTTETSRYISDMHVAGLKGRVLHMPGPKPDSPEVLFIYGHHSTIERWWGIMELFAKHNAVTMPDLPGFGGMESLYKVGKQANLDNLADWLAEFVKQRYGDKKVTMVGMSLGFVIITRMLQRHPEHTKNVRMLVSLFGFAHTKDFMIPQPRKMFYTAGAWFFSLPITSTFYRKVFLRPNVLRSGYHKTKNAKEKFKGLNNQQKREAMEFEIKLWHANDLRTHMRTAYEFLTLNNTKAEVDLPVYHIAVHNDRYFSNASVQKHFKQIFRDYRLLAELKSGTHAPTRISSAKEALPLIPAELINALGKSTAV